MDKKQLRALIQFLLVSVSVIVFALASERSIEDYWSTVIVKQEGRPQPAASLLPSPSVSPGVFGSHTASSSAVVSEVIDGDTIRLSSGETVRYIGIDTPETVHPRVEQECFGPESAQANEALVLGKTVGLELDTSETDRYGRLLRYVWVDGQLVNEVLVRGGFAEAVAYPPDTKHQHKLEQAEQAARLHQVGMWGTCFSQ